MNGWMNEWIEVCSSVECPQNCGGTVGTGKWSFAMIILKIG